MILLFHSNEKKTKQRFNQIVMCHYSIVGFAYWFVCSSPFFTSFFHAIAYVISNWLAIGIIFTAVINIIRQFYFALTNSIGFAGRTVCNL